MEILDITNPGYSDTPGVYYQPEYDEEVWEEAGFWSFFAYADKDTAIRGFPSLKILTYHDGDIEDVVIVDQL